MKEIKIEGCTNAATDDSQPVLNAFGEENTGKTRLGFSAPHDDGAIGWIPLDKNSRPEVEKYIKETKAKHIFLPNGPMVKREEFIKAARSQDSNVTKSIYSGITDRILEAGLKFAEHPSIESIVFDNATIFFDYILMAHFGRKNQIESFQRGPANQDMIDLVQALSTKNLLLIHRTADVWGNTGEVDRNNKPKQGPTGKQKPQGFKDIGAFVTVTVELSAKRLKGIDFDKKYRCKVVTCKGNTLLEGTDLGEEFGICGKNITWDGIMTAINTPAEDDD